MRLLSVLSSFGVAAALVSCGGAITPHAVAPRSEPSSCRAGEHAVVASDVSAACVADGVWVFTALAPDDEEHTGYPAANGLVVEEGDHAVLVDTGWTPAQALALVDWSVARERRVSAAIATHFHGDRVGGVASLIARGIPTFATQATIDLATAQHHVVPDHVLEPDSLPEVRWFFPGAGHTSDNIVVARGDVLFGGCFIKSLDARDLGNVADANLSEWPRSIDRVRDAFPDATIIVPGHGATGDRELLAHTRALAMLEE